MPDFNNEKDRNCVRMWVGSSENRDREKGTVSEKTESQTQRENKETKWEIKLKRFINDTSSRCGISVTVQCLRTPPPTTLWAWPIQHLTSIHHCPLPPRSSVRPHVAPHRGRVSAQDLVTLLTAVVNNRGTDAANWTDQEERLCLRHPQMFKIVALLTTIKGGQQGNRSSWVPVWPPQREHGSGWKFGLEIAELAFLLLVNIVKHCC